MEKISKAKVVTSKKIVDEFLAFEKLCRTKRCWEKNTRTGFLRMNNKVVLLRMNNIVALLN